MNTIYGSVPLIHSKKNIVINSTATTTYSRFYGIQNITKNIKCMISDFDNKHIIYISDFGVYRLNIYTNEETLIGGFLSRKNGNSIEKQEMLFNKLYWIKDSTDLSKHLLLVSSYNEIIIIEANPESILESEMTSKPIVSPIAAKKNYAIVSIDKGVLRKFISCFDIFTQTEINESNVLDVDNSIRICHVMPLVNGRNIIIHTSDNKLRMYDLDADRVVYSFRIYPQSLHNMLPATSCRYYHREHNISNVGYDTPNIFGYRPNIIKIPPMKRVSSAYSKSLKPSIPSDSDNSVEFKSGRAGETGEEESMVYSKDFCRWGINLKSRISTDGSFIIVEVDSISNEHSGFSVISVDMSLNRIVPVIDRFDSNEEILYSIEVNKSDDEDESGSESSVIAPKLNPMYYCKHDSQRIMLIDISPNNHFIAVITEPNSFSSRNSTMSIYDLKKGYYSHSYIIPHSYSYSIQNLLFTQLDTKLLLIDSRDCVRMIDISLPKSEIKNNYEHQQLKIMNFQEEAILTNKANPNLPYNYAELLKFHTNSSDESDNYLHNELGLFDDNDNDNDDDEGNQMSPIESIRCYPIYEKYQYSKGLALKNGCYVIISTFNEDSEEKSGSDSDSDSDSTHSRPPIKGNLSGLHIFDITKYMKLPILEKWIQVITHERLNRKIKN